MSYQLSIILGTAISLRKFRRPLFGPISVRFPFCFPRDGDLPLLQRGKRSQPEKGKARRPAVCTDSAIDYFHARRNTCRKEGGTVSLFGSPFSNASGSLAFDEDAATIFPREGAERKGRKGFVETRKFRRKVVLTVLLRLNGTSNSGEQANISEITMCRRISEFPVLG